MASLVGVPGLPTGPVGEPFALMGAPRFAGFFAPAGPPSGPGGPPVAGGAAGGGGEARQLPEAPGSA
ncbi:MAG: PPE domain-containing protein, partial [Chloroflexota bacterium]